MATASGFAAATEAVREQVSPALEALEKNVRQARRAVVEGKHAAEDFVATTALQIRRQPLTAVALAAGAGAAVGCLIGFVFGWRLTR